MQGVQKPKPKSGADKASIPAAVCKPSTNRLGAGILRRLYRSCFGFRAKIWGRAKNAKTEKEKLFATFASFVRHF